MDIGVIGLGVVGNAVSFSLSRLGHNVKCHDIKLDTKIEDVLKTDVCYICVPTKQMESGECDTSVVRLVVHALISNAYTGIIAIKSTVSPGTTEELIKKYYNDKICMVPEFLRERAAITDFIDNHDICVIGTVRDDVFEMVKKSHGKYPRKFFKCTPSEAEMCKYFNNLYNSTLITFANNMYDICKHLNINYDVVKNMCVNRDHINDIYLDCNENLRGFAGACLPKDIAAISFLVNKYDIPAHLFDCIINENSRYKKTVFDGMRL